MKKTLHAFLLAFSLFGAAQLQAQTVCNANGNLFLYSNYDGGLLLIDVDVNIPNIHIGVVSYEYVRIAITGTYAGNVTQVHYAGYDDSNNNCSLQGPTSTSITGATNAATGIAVAPSATLLNPNGDPNIICCYTCDTSTAQGGCNTVDQIVDYFQQMLGSTLYSHTVQYGCWPSQGVTLSSGGNCCIGASGPTLGIAAQPVQQLSILQSTDACMVALPAHAATQEVTLDVVDATGRIVFSQLVQPGTTQTMLPVQQFAAGMLFVRATWNSGSASGKLLVSH